MDFHIRPTEIWLCGCCQWQKKGKKIKEPKTISAVFLDVSVERLKQLYVSECWNWLSAKINIFRINYGNYSGVFCKHSGGSIILSEVIYICNIAQSGMLPYIRFLAAVFGQVCMRFQNHQPLGWDPRGDKAGGEIAFWALKPHAHGFHFYNSDFLGAVCSNI